MTYQLHLGCCLETLQHLPEQSVHSCVTSPPYYGLRDYGVTGQIGLEQTPEEFISKLVGVFRAVRRVLRNDGTLWLNMGDSYARRGGITDNTTDKRGRSLAHMHSVQRRLTTPPAMVKEKDLLGMPWMLAFALRADGWYLRQDIIWQKPNPMPESVRDRCTKSHEYMFLLSKSKRYYFDHNAIKEPAVGYDIRTGIWNRASKADSTDGRTERDRSRRNSFLRNSSKREQVIPGQTYGSHRPDRRESEFDITTRNRRSVWNIATHTYKGSHFATFPPALIEPCILAGSPVGGVVLDPFAGSGTTAGVAIAHGRKSILCELNPDYAAQIPDRVSGIVAAISKRKAGAA